MPDPKELLPLLEADVEPSLEPRCVEHQQDSNANRGQVKGLGLTGRSRRTPTLQYAPELPEQSPGGKRTFFRHHLQALRDDRHT